MIYMVSKGPLRLILLSTVLAGLWEGASNESAKLMASHSPFLPPSDNKEPEPIGSLELRGIVREGKTVYLTFFDGVSKKWTTVSPGEEAAGFVVESFNEDRDAAVVRIDGRALTLALKTDGTHLRESRSAAFTSMMATKLLAVPSRGVSLEASPEEAHRLDLVANEIRQQLERAKFEANAVSLPNKS